MYCLRGEYGTILARVLRGSTLLYDGKSGRIPIFGAIESTAPSMLAPLALACDLAWHEKY